MTNNDLELKTKVVTAKGVKFSLVEDDLEVARAYLYVMRNELHSEPFGLLEDVHVHESYRGSGLGTELVRQVIAAAKEQNCYKLVATSRKSRPRVHQLYERLGFKARGFEFRIDL